MPVIIHLSKLAEYITPRMNPNVNYELWAIMMCQIGSSIVTNVPTLMQDVSSRGGRGMSGEEFSVLSAQFCYELKTTLKK